MYILKNIYGLLLNVLLFVFSWIVPKRAGFVLLGGGLGQRFSGNPKYYFLYLNRLLMQGRLSSINFLWITKSDNVKARLNEKRLPVVDGRTLKGFWSILRAEYIIIESGPADKRGGHDVAYQRLFIGNYKIVQTWHGSPSKHILLDALNDQKNKSLFFRLYSFFEKIELSRFWLIITMGEREQSILKKAFNNNRVEILGYPKNDYLIKNIGTKSFFHHYEKVILYAPSFRDSVSHKKAFSEYTLSKIDDYFRANNTIFLVKKHPFDTQFNIKPIYSNIQDITCDFEEIQEILPSIDLLITDYSSVYVDFLLLRRDVVFYTYDYDEYISQSREFYFNYFDNKNSVVLSNEKDFIEFIFSYEIGHYVVNESVLNEYHFFKDALSCTRLTNRLMQGMK